MAIERSADTKGSKIFWLLIVGEASKRYWKGESRV